MLSTKSLSTLVNKEYMWHHFLSSIPMITSFRTTFRSLPSTSYIFSCTNDEYIYFILGVWNKKNDIPKNENSNEEMSLNIVIMNADGVYLATYSALLFNLKLMKRGCYHDDTKAIPMLEVRFY